MSLKDDSQKSGTNAKSGVSANTTKSGGAKNSGDGKSASQSTRSGNHDFQAHDIKSLVQNHGRANLGGQEWALKAPSWNDSALQAIISDPKFTARATGRSPVDGKVTYELHGHGKTINVTISH